MSLRRRTTLKKYLKMVTEMSELYRCPNCDAFPLPMRVVWTGDFGRVCAECGHSFTDLELQESAKIESPNGGV